MKRIELVVNKILNYNTARYSNIRCNVKILRNTRTAITNHLKTYPYPEIPRITAHSPSISARKKTML